MTSTVRPSSTFGAAPRTLANAALPPRVRHILEAVNALAGQTLTTSLNLALNEFERQLFKQADRARSSQHQSEHFAELQRVCPYLTPASQPGSFYLRVKGEGAVHGLQSANRGGGTLPDTPPP